MDGTYINVKGAMEYLYRAVGKQGKTVDFLLTAKRNKATAIRFFTQAMHNNDVPGKLTMDKSGANKAAVDGLNMQREIPITIRRVKISTIPWNRIIVPSNGLPGQCLASILFALRKQSSQVSNSCT
jgi:transposase-like protein